jgi:hypothetical protein
MKGGKGPTKVPGKGPTKGPTKGNQTGNNSQIPSGSNQSNGSSNTADLSFDSMIESAIKTKEYGGLFNDDINSETAMKSLNKAYPDYINILKSLINNELKPTPEKQPTPGDIEKSLSKQIVNLQKKYEEEKLRKIYEDILKNISIDSDKILTPFESVEIILCILKKYIFDKNAIQYDRNENEKKDKLLIDKLRNSLDPYFENFFENFIKGFGSFSFSFTGGKSCIEEKSLEKKTANIKEPIPPMSASSTNEEIIENILKKIQKNIYEKLLNEKANENNEKNYFIYKIQLIYFTVLIDKTTDVIKKVINDTNFKKEIKKLIIDIEPKINLIFEKIPQF